MRPDPQIHPRIRTFHARRGRLSDRMRETLRSVLPRYDPDRRRRPGAPLVIEVGCGHGEAALAFARAHPDVDVIAVDVHSPGVVSVLDSLMADDPGNVSVVAGDALDLLDQRVRTAEVAGLHAFFADPWPKARHHKRRFIRPDVLDLLADRLASGAVLAFATDAPDYADWARSHLDAHRAFDGGVGDRPWWRPVAGYEAKAIAAGRPVVDLAYHRR